MKNMDKPSYVYDLDDRPPFHYNVLYGLQWSFIAFPVVIIITTMAGTALQLNLSGSIRFIQMTFFTSGVFTFVQTLWGHRYPVLEGPSAPVLLTFMLLAPYGLPAMQGGTIIGGALLLFIVFTKQLNRVIRLFTPNVVGVILLLIAFGLLVPLLKFMTGVNETDPHGDPQTMMISFALIFLMATLSYHLEGFWKSISILIGMIVGSFAFLLLGRFSWESLASASWISFSISWLDSVPGFFWPTAIAFACSYLAVMVNSLGSLQGIAAITDQDRLPLAISRGIFVNGVAGIFCGLLGVVGTVSYSLSPGVVLANRVASRYAVTYCGVILVMAVFIPKLAALLSLMPMPVVGSALCVAMGGQIGAAISIIASKTITPRDYIVVGLPILMGTLAGLFPGGLFSSLPGFIQVFFSNSLIVGIVAVLLFEHVLCRNK
jgi:uracil permease